MLNFFLELIKPTNNTTQTKEIKTEVKTTQTEDDKEENIFKIEYFRTFFPKFTITDYHKLTDHYQRVIYKVVDSHIKNNYHSNYNIVSDCYLYSTWSVSLRYNKRDLMSYGMDSDLVTKDTNTSIEETEIKMSEIADIMIKKFSNCIEEHEQTIKTHSSFDVKEAIKKYNI